MAFDSGFCNAVVNELQKGVVGAKAEKVYMPEKDSVVISLYISGRNKKDTNLILSCSPSSPRISVGADERENPSTPTGFCMLLRKHIASSKVVSAEQYGFDFYTDNEDDIIYSDEVDIVDICTPNIYHYETAKKAILAKKNVYCEKPLAVNYEQAKELLYAC